MQARSYSLSKMVEGEASNVISQLFPSSLAHALVRYLLVCLQPKFTGHSQSNTSSLDTQLVHSRWPGFVRDFLRHAPINSPWVSEDVEHFCNANVSAVVYITPGQEIMSHNLLSRSN